MQPDLVIRGGLVFDGSGAPPQTLDIAVIGDRIAAIGRDIPQGRREIDAAGLYVAPGFIDIHSHSDFTLLIDPRAMSSIHQGVTLEVIGNCGFGCFPIRDPALSAGSIYGYDAAFGMDWHSTAGYLARLEQAGPAVNVLTLTPNAQLRLATVGMSGAPAREDEVRAMSRLLEQSFDEGSWGYSTGLEYPAEAGASREEIGELCRCASRHGRIYATHTRYRDEGSVEAVEEALETARRAQVKLQISHLLPRSGHDDGLRCMELVDRAVASGQDVAYDMHTRLHGLTYLSAALPGWARPGTADEIRTRLASADVRRRMREFRSIITASGDFSRVILLDHPRWPDYSRRTLAEIAALRGQDPYDTLYDLIAEIADDLTSAMVLIAAYSQQQQDEVFSHPLCMPASDATALATDGPLAGRMFHGAYSWAALFFRRMVRETGRLTAEEAIRKMTGQPAEVLGLSGRGRLAAGNFADIAIFDPDAFTDRATLFEPSVPASGMMHVLVNGVLTLSHGRLTGERRGAVLRPR